VAKVARDRAGNRYAQIDPRVQRRRERGRPAAAGQAHHNYPLVTQHLDNAVLFVGLFKRMSGSESRKRNENERLDLAHLLCVVDRQDDRLHKEFASCDALLLQTEPPGVIAPATPAENALC
jgi:hypothetical protein